MREHGNAARMDAALRAAGGVLTEFFKTRAILKLAVAATAVFLLARFASWIPTVQVTRSALPESRGSAAAVSRGEIAKTAGEVLAAENGGRKMYVDCATMNIRIVDDETGLTWNALRRGEGAAEDQSLIRVAFVSEDDAVSRWDSYNYSLKEGGYTLERIADGVRINVHIGNAEPADLNEFMPRRIAVDRYERVFVAGLEEKAGQGVLAASEAARYKDVLNLIYAKDEEKGFYYNKLQASPPGSAVKQMLAMTRALGYTVDQLIGDEAPYDLPAQERRPPVGFVIPLEFTLEDGDLAAKVSTGQIVVENGYYTLTQITVLPNFGSVSAGECPEGFIFVPDGSGALVALNSFDPGYNGYERPLYRNTVFRDKGSLPQFPEDLSMPVFGMIYGGAGGFMGVVEAGDETAFTGFRAASPRAGSGGAMYNTVYAGFDAAQYQQLGIAGADTNGGSYTVGTGMLDMDFIVRYKLFSGPVSYFDMAALYKQYLIKKYGLKENYQHAPRVYLDVTGAVTVEGRFLGKAYRRTVSMTGYGALAGILKSLEGVPKTVAYNGVFNGGLDNKLSNRAVPVPRNGPARDLEALLDYAENDPGTELFMGVNLARVSLPGNGYDGGTHAARGYDGEPAFFWGYNYADNAPNPLSPWYSQLDPRYISGVVDRFLSAAGRYDRLYVNDLGTDYYASYKQNALVPPGPARRIAEENLKKLASGKTLALNNPGADKLPYAAYAVNISRESSNYGGFYTPVPFRHLVMNGLVSYTTLDANMSGESPDYYLLQALELGSVPKFSITGENADALKYTEHTEFLATAFETQREKIRSLYERYKREFAKINSARIVNHETLGDLVFRTTYANGVTVTVNYNRFPVALAGGSADDGPALGPLGYIIGEIGENR